MIIKEQKLHTELSFFHKSSRNIICSSTALNELIISHYISKLRKYYDHIQKFYGYNILKNNLIIFKEYIHNNFTSKYELFTSYEKSLIILHSLLTLYETFQNKKYIIGHHNDFKPRNIILKKVKYKERLCIIDELNIKLPVNNYIPVIIDFGSSELIKCFNKRINIKRFNWRILYKNKIDKRCFYISKFNPCKDIQKFFYFLIKKNPDELICKIYNNLCKKFGKNKVTIKHIFSHPDIKKFLL